MFLSSSDRVIRAKKGTSGVHIIKTVQAIICCVYDEPIVPEQAGIFSHTGEEDLLRRYTRLDYSTWPLLSLFLATLMDLYMKKYSTSDSEHSWRWHLSEDSQI